MEKWVVTAKKADFQEIGVRYRIDPVIARIIRNRDIVGDEAIDQYLNGKLADIPSWKSLKDIENVEKDKINELVLENPNYFYDILPYAYVLGVSDKWSKNFESIAVEPPTWYSGTNFDTFNVVSFNNSLNKTINSASSSMNSRPYESSGGSSSGGFSGGGSGGGGGSSW